MSFGSICGVCTCAAVRLQSRQPRSQRKSPHCGVRAGVFRMQVFLDRPQDHQGVYMIMPHTYTCERGWCRGW